MMETVERLDEITKLLGQDGGSALLDFVTEIHPADISLCFSKLEEAQQRAFTLALPPQKIAELLPYLPTSEASEVLAWRPSSEHAAIFDQLNDDDLVDLLQSLKIGQSRAAIHLLPESKKALAQSLLSYPEDTAGGRMTTNFATVYPEMTIREAIENLRENAEITEVLARIFVVGKDTGKLLGKVRLRDLTFNRRSTHIRDVMSDETISVRAGADQEAAVMMMSKYNIFALPVTNQKSQLLGVITYDDALEIQEEESTEDLEKQSAISGTPSDERYLETPVLEHIKRRFGWVLFLALIAIVSGLVIKQYEELITQTIVLAVYMPMIVAAGGNTGGQAATMVIRAMSLGEFSPSSFAKVAWKECRVGILIGGLLGLCIGLQIHFLPVTTEFPEGTNVSNIALTVCLALTAQVATSTLVGALLPILAKSARLDPAVVASPAITTVVDITGLIIYFSLAKWILHL